MEINNTISSELTDLFIGTDRIFSICLGNNTIWSNPITTGTGGDGSD